MKHFVNRDYHILTGVSSEHCLEKLYQPCHSERGYFRIRRYFKSYGKKLKS